MLSKLTLMGRPGLDRPLAFDAMSASEGLNVALGDVVRRHREERGWSQQRLADLAGIAKSTVRNTEHGRVKWGYRIDKMADALDVPISQLMAEAEERVKSMFPDVATFVNELMAKRGISDADLARAMGVDLDDIRRLKQGNVGPVIWGAAAVALDIDPRLMESIALGEQKPDQDDDNGRFSRWDTGRP